MRRPLHSLYISLQRQRRYVVVEELQGWLNSQVGRLFVVIYLLLGTTYVARMVWKSSSEILQADWAQRLRSQEHCAISADRSRMILLLVFDPSSNNITSGRYPH